MDPEIEALIGPSGTVALRDKLLECCPPDDRSVPALARHLEITHQAIYKWIKEDKITPIMAKRLSELSDGRVALHDFDPWVYRE
jgi:hypothetical protein